MKTISILLLLIVGILLYTLHAVHDENSIPVILPKTVVDPQPISNAAYCGYHECN